jgi:methionyl-tRNA formyltransferase
MKVVFFGSPTAALPPFEALLREGHRVELVVTQPDRPAGRGRKLAASEVKRFAVSRGIPVLEPARIRTDEHALERIREAAPEVNVVVAYGQIIPDAIIYWPRHRSLNVHFSLLPRYRGAAPVQWTILNGDRETGVTIIELNDRMDEGDILARAKVPVGAHETAPELEARLAVKGAELLLETLRRIDRVPRVAQDPAQASLAPKIRKEDGRIDWREPAEAVDRRIRALASNPGAFSFLKGRRLQIHRGKGLPGGDPSAAPGTVLAVGREGLLVSCGGRTSYLIEKLQAEGRAAMGAYDFSLGTKLEAGDRLGGD